jgi:hypothetical protein
MAGTVDIADVVNPNSGSSPAERAWHYLLSGFNSGYMYYGTALDMEVKPSLAANRACSLANQVINASPGTDNTPPNVFIPQRFPYNPGGTGFGPVYGYQQFQNSSDFHIWTFAYDVSGMQSVTLKYRTDFDGENPIADNQNETYAGGSNVSSWQSIAMTSRAFPTGNVTNNSNISFFILPDHIADEYYAEITGLHDTLVDYYIEAVDQHGNITKTPIQHVYVGSSNPGGSANGIYWQPSYPTINDTITVHVPNPTTTGQMHWGVNGWQQVNNVYWPAGSTLFNGSGPAIESRMDTINGELQIKIGPFNNVAQSVNYVDFVVHYDNNTWDNNGGADYHIPISQPVSSPSADKRGLHALAYPNPALAQFDLDIQQASDHHYWLEMVDISGKVLSRSLIEPGKHRMMRGDLPSGTYFLQLEGVETRERIHLKLVLQ